MLLMVESTPEFGILEVAQARQISKERMSKVVKGAFW